MPNIVPAYDWARIEYRPAVEQWQTSTAFRRRPNIAFSPPTARGAISRQ